MDPSPQRENYAMTTHTPGPLDIRAIDFGDFLITTPERTDQRRTSGSDVIGRAYGDGHLPGEANARLWAAAPDLLAAAEKAMSETKGLLGGYSMLRAAVAKAKGTKP